MPKKKEVAQKRVQGKEEYAAEIKKAVADYMVGMAYLKALGDQLNSQ